MDVKTVEALSAEGWDKRRMYVEDPVREFFVYLLVDDCKEACEDYKVNACRFKCIGKCL